MPKPPKINKPSPLAAKNQAPVRSTDWREILRACGYPTDVLVLDYESYFDKDYRMGRKRTDLSTIEFVKDKRYETLGLAIYRCIDGDESNDWYHGEQMTHTVLGALRKRFGQHLEGVTVVAQNAKYDLAVSAAHFDLYPRYFIDLLGLAKHWNARTKNGLDAIAKREKLSQEKGDTDEFLGCSNRVRFVLPKKKGRSKLIPAPVMVPPMNEEMKQKLATYALGDTQLEWEAFKLLLPRLSRPDVELPLIQHTIELFTKPSLHVDPPKGREIIREMEKELDQVCVRVGMSNEEISGNISFDAAMSQRLIEAGDDPSLYMKKNKKNQWVMAVAKTDDSREELLTHACKAVRELIEARIALKSWPTHITRVNRILDQAAANDDVLCIPLNYCGAHTLRFSGGERINLQNLGSRGHPLVSMIREIIIAADGRVLVIVDASQIEARVLAWIAGQWDLCEQFAKNVEVYARFASKVLGYPVRKPRKGGIEAVEEKHKWARNSVGKVGVLGCGYGMGANKAVGYSGGAIDIDTAKIIVQTYREENDQIVNFWHDMEGAFMYTARTGNPTELPRGVRFDQRPGCDIVMTMPCGREMKYHDVRIAQGKYGEQAEVFNHAEKCWEKTWGGTLTENVVQSMSRHILVEAMMRLERRGLKTAHHIHDELVMHVPQDQGEEALAAGIEELSRRPEWAPDCPLGAEGLVTARYGGH